MRPGSFPDLLRFSRRAVAAALERCRAEAPDRPLLAVDGTCGNGHDTLFLAQTLADLCGRDFRVVGFDVQSAALDKTRARLLAANMAGGVELRLEGHERLGQFLAGRARPGEHPDEHQEGTVLSGRGEEPAGRSDEGGPLGGGGTADESVFAAAMYNLGFLPGGGSGVTTRPESSIVSLEAAARFLAPRGLVSVHAYGGHPGGLEELLAVEEWFCARPTALWVVARYSFCNKPQNPEVLYLAEKKA